MIAIETLVAKRTWALTRDGEQEVSESGIKVRPPLGCEMIPSHFILCWGATTIGDVIATHSAVVMNVAYMVRVTQLVECRTVTADVAGSCPVFHPTLHIYFFIDFSKNL